MPSLIPGYEYDIFISYRQKDNKYDGWVTEFVDNLKKELEATFKEEISVYFDINPHDGLLETHDVDASLKDKLKCLVFIPIISRTYCDPKSFAWEHEFIAFVEQASQDQFGLKVKLPNGNVASRVLPVRIHDLDQEDIKLCESILGGVLRSVDFIFKSSGVNRPLRANEDHPQDNLNKTYYRDQINKVANAVKEIISALKKPGQQGEEVPEKIIKAKPEKPRNLKTRFIIVPLLVLALIALGYLFLPDLFKPAETIEKSIAVLPFVNLSNDPEQEYFSEGMVDEILDRLFKIGDLKVISRTTTMSYKNTSLSLKEIAHELNVSAILEGSVRKMGNKVRITVQLIDARTDTHLWSEIYDKDISDIFSIQSEVAQAVARKLKAVIKPEEKHLIEKVPTDNLEAYDYYLLGEHLRNQRTPESLWKAKTLYEKSIEADPGFVRAFTGLARCYGNLAFYANLRPKEAYPPALDLAFKALELDSLFADAYDVIGMVDLFYNFDFVNAERNYKRCLELDPKNLDIYKAYSELLFFKGRFSEAIEMDHRALSIDPVYPLRDGLYGVHLYFAHQKDSAISHLSKMSERYPVCHFYLGVIYLHEGDYEKSINEIEKTFPGFSPLSITMLGLAYSKSGALNETKRMLDTLEVRAKTEFVPYSMRGALMAELDRKKEALDDLQKGYEEKEEFLLLLMHIDTISFLNLRSNPEFTKIMGKVRVEQ
jgi:adenylate cyclase